MDPKIEKKQLFEAVAISPEELAEAEAVFHDAKRKLALATSVISSVAVSLCHVVFTRHPDISTFAVKLAGDGNPLLMMNVDFIRKIGADQSVFALVHEVYHLLMMHLHCDPALMKNENWITATEACINRRVMIHTSRPLITVDGEVAIVDPKKVHERYKDGIKKLNETARAANPNASERVALTMEEFYKTDLGCFAALEELPKPLKPKGMNNCVHASNGGAGENGDGDPAPLDQSEVDKFMGKVLESAIQEAKNGRPGAKDEILDWMDASPEATKTWGDLGAGALRGETTHTRKTDLWERWTSDIVGSKLEDGNRLRYQKKIPWAPRVTAHGKQPKKYGSVFVDASGSMHPEVLKKIADLIGEMEELHIEWHSFDGEVWPFEIGGGFRGGGGTSFQIIDDHVQNGGLKQNADSECCEEDLDFVLVITDGYAPHINPRDAEKWIWLIVPNGDDWPLAAGMSCRQIDLV